MIFSGIHVMLLDPMCKGQRSQQFQFLYTEHITIVVLWSFMMIMTDDSFNETVMTVVNKVRKSLFEDFRWIPYKFCWIKIYFGRSSSVISICKAGYKIKMQIVFKTHCLMRRVLCVSRQFESPETDERNSFHNIN